MCLLNVHTHVPILHTTAVSSVCVCVCSLLSIYGVRVDILCDVLCVFLYDQGSKFINSWHNRPEQILPVGELVLVATRASALYVFDRQQHEVLRKFDVTPVISLLGISTFSFNLY